MNSAARDSEETGEGARGAKDPRRPPSRSRALVPVPAAPASGFFAGLGRSHGIVAAGVAVVMGIGFVAGTEVLAGKSRPVSVAQAGPPPDTTMDVLYRVQGEVRSLKASLEGLRASAEDGRQAETIRGLKKGVDALKQDLEGVKSASASAVGQLGAKLDRLDRDPGPKLAEIAARLDKLDRDPGTRIAEVTARLDRVERQVAAADATGSLPQQPASSTAQAKPPTPPQRAAQSAPVAAASPVAAVPPQRPETAAKADGARPEVNLHPEAVAKAEPQPRQQEANARPAILEGWMLRDVYGGVALLEGRAGGLREVAPGEYVPGVGEIRSIERRGRGWVVVTSRGLIQADNRW